MRTNSKTKPPVDFDDLLGIEPVVEAIKPHQNLPTFVSEGDLANRWGVSTRQVRTLVTEAVIRRVAGKQFDYVEATRAYIGRLIEQASRRAANDPALAAEKLRLVQAQREKLELQNQEKRGELVSVREVEAGWASIVIDLRAAVMNIPARVTANMGLDRATGAKLDAEIRLALEAISDEH